MAETITLEKFYSSSLGQYALRWEQNQYDKLVSDCFGYNAVQLGATGIDFLKNNRIGLKVAAEPTLRPLTQLLETDDRVPLQDRKSTRLNSSHANESRMPSSA